MQKIFFLSLLGLIIAFSLSAQNANSRQYDREVQKCVESNPSFRNALGKHFEIFEWAKTLQNHVAEAKDNQNAAVLIEIAEQRSVVDDLLSLSKSCKALEKLTSHLQKMQKIYSTGVKDKSKNNHTGKGFEEERTVTMNYVDVVRLKLHVNALVNMMEGDESIFRVFR
jgi:hypothetical protein